jgi:hypothetical protein
MEDQMLRIDVTTWLHRYRPWRFATEHPADCWKHKSQNQWGSNDQISLRGRRQEDDGWGIRETVVCRHTPEGRRVFLAAERRSLLTGPCFYL